MDWKAFFGTMIGLALLDGVLSSRQSTQNVGAAENGLIGLLQKFLDPSTPAFATSGATGWSAGTPSLGPQLEPSTGPSPGPGLGNKPHRSGYSWNGNAG